MPQAVFSNATERVMAVDSIWLFPAGQQEEVQEQVAAQQRQLLEAALQLSSRRREAGGKLKAAVEQCLAELAMQDSQFDVDLTWLPIQQARIKCLSVHHCMHSLSCGSCHCTACKNSTSVLTKADAMIL